MNGLLNGLKIIALIKVSKRHSASHIENENNRFSSRARRCHIKPLTDKSSIASASQLALGAVPAVVVVPSPA
jgi:hypothetical protein